MGVSSVDRAGLNPARCGCNLSSMQSLARRSAMRSISLHSALVSVTGRKDTVLLADFFGFMMGAMKSCSRLAGTCPPRKLQLNSRSMHFFVSLPSCFRSSRRISSSPGAVPEDSSRSATSNSASVMGWSVLHLVLSIFISGACCGFVGLAMRMLANACACCRLVSGWPYTTSTGDVSGSGAHIAFADDHVFVPSVVSNDASSFH
ncbi:hypothetical protein TRVL_09894 [Trypanosoma vivax]|nr:hypothetical protein TRVL_09894 [Trypanosoma vivax]